MHIPLISSLLKRTDRNAGWFAVSIGHAGVYFACVRLSGHRPRVELCAFHEIGEITPATLEKLRKDARVGHFQFITLLAPGEYQMLMVDVPNVPLGELKTAVRWRIKDNLSYHVDDATVDVLQIPAKSVGDRPQSLYAIAASNDTIRKCIALFEQAKIDLCVIDIPETAQRNVAGLFEEKGRGLAMLAFDDSGGLLTFTFGGELYLARRLDITAGQLQDASEGLRQQAIDRVELEVQRSLDYFDRQFNHVPVSRLLIATHEHSGLVKALAERLDLPVERMDLSQVMDISAVPGLADNDFAAFALPALGAALRQERRAL